jgi:hypothetical protein
MEASPACCREPGLLPTVDRQDLREPESHLKTARIITVPDRVFAPGMNAPEPVRKISKIRERLPRSAWQPQGPSSMRYGVSNYELGELNHETSKLSVFFHDRADVSFVGI